jgi:hypothetical protein
MRRVIVDPPGALHLRPRLFSAIAEAVDVRFVPSDGPPLDARAAIVFGESNGFAALPTLVLPANSPAGQDALVDVTFVSDRRIDRTLWGASLPHRAFSSGGLPDVAESSVLARAGYEPVWVRSGEVDHVAAGISELGASEPLRSRFQSGCFLPLLPIVDFLRRTAPERFMPPSLRAAFLFDDPNLHGMSYGHLDYRLLVEDAVRTGYHVAFATIPLDTWYASRRAVELFRVHRDVLSLIVHGNTHIKRELSRPLDPDARRALLRQGLARIERFERRYRVHVGRVMAPPHGACSEAMAAEMPALGYEALCISRPYPWLEQPPPDRVLAGWRPTEILASGLPVIPRLHFHADRSEIVLRAFLGQPVVLYGHHGDVRDGLDILRGASDEINRLGDVRWGSLDQIVSNMYETRVDGQRLFLRLFTRRATVRVPEGISHLHVEWSGSATSEPVIVNGKPADESGVSIASGATAEIRVTRDGPQPDGRVSRRVQIWPYVRRGLAESRDRVLPLVQRS